MARSATKLADELKAIVPSLSTTNTGLALATAYGAYMKDAVAATPIIAAAVDTAVTSMAGVMTFEEGMTAAQGATVLRDGLGVFWNAMGTAPASFFAGATAISPPPGISSALDASLATAFVDNTADGTTAQEAADAIASVLHTASNGGTVTTPGPTVTPIA